MCTCRRRYVFMLLVGALVGCVFHPGQLAQWTTEEQPFPELTVGDVAREQISDPNAPAFHAPAASAAPIHVRISNPTPRDADVRITMELVGHEVHFSLRRVVAASAAIVIGPERADIVRVGVTFLREPPIVLDTQVLRIGEDFEPGDIIEVVLELPEEDGERPPPPPPPAPPTVAIAGLDQDISVFAGAVVAFEIVTGNAGDDALVAAFADPDAQAGSGDEIAIVADVPAAVETSVLWITEGVAPGTYAIYAELSDAGAVIRSAPAPGRVTIQAVPPPVGACCLPDGSCVELAEADCAAGAGAYQGDFSPCDPNPCPPPVGACCYADGTCAIVAEAECVEGQWLGPDVSCEPDPCVPPPPACPADALYSQPAHEWFEPWAPAPSEAGGEGSYTLAIDGFGDVVGQVGGVQWWGLTAAFDRAPGCYECVESDPTFQITFYEDDDGLPGAPLCSYVGRATVVRTGLYYGTCELLHFTLDGFSPACVVGSGWLSIQGGGDPDCWFFWMSSPVGDGFSWLDWGGELTGREHDLAFCLTPASAPVSDGP